MKFRKKPEIASRKDTKRKERLANKILSGADKPASVSPKTSKARKVRKKEPWEKIKENKDVVVFSFRIPKKEIQKLKYISQQTSMSINTICLRSIKSYSRKILKEIKKEIRK